MALRIVCLLLSGALQDDGFEARRHALLEALSGPDMLADLYGNRAVANLSVPKHQAESNATLRRVAEWFDRPHPHGRDHRGECDFAAIKLCRAYHLFRGGKPLEAETLDRMKRFFLSRDFRSIYHSENHHFLFHTSRYLMAQAYPDETFTAFKKLGSELMKEDRAWLIRFIRYRAECGWGEFDSSGYISPEWECLTCLYDFSEDAELRRISGMMLDLLLADVGVDTLRGMHGGAHGRIYESEARDHSATASYALQYLYFDTVKAKAEGTWTSSLDQMSSDKAKSRKQWQYSVDELTSKYRPSPLIVEITRGRDTPYENRERKHLHNTSDVLPEHPLDGSIRKYTYWAPDYVMGCVVYQDPYPPSCPGRSYAHHEQHEWDLTFGTKPEARLFTQHPGKNGYEHGYWTGDLLCCCGHFYQNKTALVALYDIPADQPLAFIHAYVPRDLFDEVVEEDGFIFVREGGAFAALKMLGGYEWVKEGEWKGVEVRSEGRRKGVVCEVGRAKDYESFQAFRRDVATNRIEFDAEGLRLTYQSRRAGKLFLDARGTRRLDDVDADLSYPTYDNPFMRSEWKSGVIDLKKGGRTLRLDFTTPK